MFKKYIVQGCTDYNLLGFIPFNRHYGYREDLAIKIKDQGFIHPMMVVLTDAMPGQKKGIFKPYILDGQNRHVTVEEMKHSFDYVVVAKTSDLDEIAAMVISYNSESRAWIAENYIRLYMHFGYPDYRYLFNLANRDKKNPVSYTTVYSLLMGATKRAYSGPLQNGAFVITHRRQTVAILEEIKEMRKVLTKVTNRMILGFAAFYVSAPTYNRNKFMRKLTQSGDEVWRYSESDKFRDFFTYIYK